MPVLGRFLLTARGNRFSTLQVGRWAISRLTAAIPVLLLLPLDLIWRGAFAVLFGLSNGVLTILRGTALAELFGRERYAELNGALSAPAVLAKAAAPLALAGAVVWKRRTRVGVWCHPGIRPDRSGRTGDGIAGKGGMARGGQDAIGVTNTFRSVIPIPPNATLGGESDRRSRTPGERVKAWADAALPLGAH